MSSGPLPTSYYTSCEGSPRALNPSTLSTKSRRFPPDEGVPGIATHDQPRYSESTPEQTTKDCVFVNHDPIASQHQGDNPVINIRSIPEREQAPQEERIISQTTSQGNETNIQISSRTRSVRLAQKQCSCFPYFKYLGCGKNP